MLKKNKNVSGKNRLTYKNSGVDTHAGQKFVKAIRESVHSTHNPNVLGGLGGFSAAYDVSFLKSYEEPVLLSGTDGVGTKIEIAKLLNKHDTIGIDLVAMCVNDLLVSGGKPLFFLDYIACGKLNVKKMKEIVSGIAEGCRQAGAALVGGETAEHPGTMEEGEYDLGGFAVGVVEKRKMINGSTIAAGDVVIGLASSGPHSNGFSLLRKMFLKNKKLPVNRNDLKFIREYLMAPTRIYVKPVLSLLEKEPVKGMVHITGGGFYENIPRVLGDKHAIRIEKTKIPENYVFSKIRQDFKISEKELFSTFNMGIGYILVVSPDRADAAIAHLNVSGEKAFVVGDVVKRKTTGFELV